jgi:hypothetical protein
VGTRGAQTAEHGAAAAGYCKEESCGVVESVVRKASSGPAAADRGGEGIAAKDGTW